MNRRKMKYIIYAVILLVIIGLSVGFSALQRQLLIDDSIFNVRLQEDTRVSANSVSKTGGSAISNYEDYNVSKIYGSVTFPNTSSYVLYKVDLTNYGNVKTGLLNITSNTSGVNYSICDSNGSNCTSNPKTSVCNGSNCTLGSTKSIYVKVTSASTGTKNVDLDLNFQPFHTIGYDNFQENTSSFQTEIMETDTYEVTLTSDVEEVSVSGDGFATYNKNNHKLTISAVSGNITVSAKYKATTIAETSYSGSNPNNYVRFDDTLYRIITKETIDDGYGNPELRTKLVKVESIGKNAFDSNYDDFENSSLRTLLNTTYYGSLSEDDKELIDTALWDDDNVTVADYIGLISLDDYNNNASWLNFEQYIMHAYDEGKFYALQSGSLTNVTITTQLDTHPVIYLKENTLVVGGSGTSTNPYLLDLSDGGLQANPTQIKGRNLTVTGSNQDLVTVENKVGTPYYSTSTQLNSTNYTSGSTTIPKATNVGTYYIYYYIPAGSNYKAKSGRVKTTIEGITYTINYTKGENISEIGKTHDSCTTSGSALSCSVTLPSITPNNGWENAKWNNGSNNYNPGASFTLNSSNNGITMTSSVTGKTYTATFYYNTNTTLGSLTVDTTTSTCTVVDGTSCTVSVPTAVSGSIGKYNSLYKGVSRTQGNLNSGSLELTENQNFYAHYSSSVTYYHYGTNQYVSDGIFRNEYFTSNTASSVVLASSNTSTTSVNIDDGPGGSDYVGLSKDQNTSVEYGTMSIAAQSDANTIYTVYKFDISYQKGANVSSIGNDATGTSCNVVYNDTSCNITLPTITANPGYTPVGWSTTSGATTGATGSYSVNTDDLVLYANAKGNTYTATFYYNSDTTSGNLVVASASAECTVTSGSNCTVVVPAAVQNSVGKYNSVYKGVSANTSLMDESSLAISDNTSTFYAIYSSEVTRYYYSSGYKSNTIYRNEYFIDNTQMQSVLTTVDNGTTNYTTSRGPGSSNFYGLSTAQDTITEYNTVQEAANSDSATLFTVYQFVINYQKGANVSNIGADTSDTCEVTTSDTSCSVILPTITPNTDYTSVGWSLTNGDTTGEPALSLFFVNNNNRVLYANAIMTYYQNIDTNALYQTLNDAFSNVEDDETIQVLRNITETTGATLANTKSGIKLDLNGKTITMSNTYIQNDGELDIYNTSSTDGKIQGGGGQVLNNNGTLTLNDTSSTNKIIIDKTLGSNTAVVHNLASKSLEVNNNVEIKVSNGTASGINNSGTVTISGGTITSSSAGIYNLGTVTISGGTITGATYGINNQPNGELNISGSSTQITGTSYEGIYNYGDTTISGGTISSPSYGVNNTSVTESGNTYYGNITITGGIVQSSANHGIYVSGGTTLTLGVKDSTVSTSSPLIQTTGSSNKYGINVNSSGTFNFYDGIIKSSSGTGYAINGTVSDTPTNYEVYKETNNGIESAFLIKPGILMQGTNGGETTNYLRTNIKKQDIESITFTNSLSGHTANGTDCFDVSKDNDGSVLAWVSDSNSNSKYEMTIGAYGGVQAYSGYYLFSQLRNLDSLNGMDYFDTSNVTNMTYMFRYTGYSTTFTLDLGSKFDTSNVTNMQGMFYETGRNSTVFTLDLGDKFDTSNVTNMNSMFASTGRSSTVFTLDLGSKFDTSNVTNMYQMFSYTGHSSTTFTLDLGNKFDTSNVTNMSYMFYYTGYTSPIFTLDLGDNFDTSNVTNMYCMFYYTGYTSPIFTLDLGDNFDTSNVTDMSSMFSHTGYSSTVFTLDLGDKFDTSNVTTMSNMFYHTGRSSTTFTLDLGDNFDTSNVTDMSSMFNNTGRSITTFTLDLGDKFDTSKVTNMSSMFSYAGYNSTSFTLDLGDKFDTSNVTNMSQMFYSSRYLETIYVPSSFVTSNVTSSTNMFDGCTSLVGGAGTAYTASNPKDKTYAHYDGGSSNPGYFTGKGGVLMGGSIGDATTNFLRTNIAKQDIEILTFTSYLGNHTVNGTDCFDVSKDNDGSVLAWVTDTDSDGKYEITIGANGIIHASTGYYLFTYLENLDSLNGMDYFDTSNVTGMERMFLRTGRNSTVFTLDLGNKFDTSKVTRMEYMFMQAGYSSPNFTLDLGDKFDTSNVTNMEFMFKCIGYSSPNFTLDLGNKFDTSNVTKMSSMFSYAGYNSTTLTLDLGDKFNTSNVTDMNAMFQNAGHSDSTFTLDLGNNFDTSNVTNMRDMFQLTGVGNPTFTLDLSRFNTSNVTDMYAMFNGSSSLKTIYASSNFNTSNVTNSDYMFTGCTSLVGGLGTAYSSSHIDKAYAHIDEGTSNPGYFTEKDSKVATFYYNSNTTSGELTVATKKASCVPASGQTSCAVVVPSEVMGSVGKYNSAYKGVSTSTGSMASSVLTISANTNFYANYSSSVTNYYYNSGYTSRTIYRNEFFSSASAMNAVLSTTNTGTSNYSTASGPGSSVWYGLSTAKDTTREYSSVSGAATSGNMTLYTIYTFNVTYAQGSNVTGIGATSGSCRVTTSSTSCNVTLPSITVGSLYYSVGWNTTSGATSGTAAGSTYSLSTNGITLYANGKAKTAATIPTNTLCKCTAISTCDSSYSTFHYTGAARTLTTATSGTGYTLSGYSQTNVNTSGYTITATLENNYKWSDNTVGTKTFKCYLPKATPIITLSATSGSVMIGNTTTFTATVKSGATSASVAGSLTASSASTSYATVSPTSKSITGADNSTGVATTETVTGVSNGSSTITVKFTPTDTTNYNSAANKTYAATVNKRTTLYVASTGNDSNGKGTIAKPYLTLPKAYTMAADTATIYVMDSLTISSSITMSSNKTITLRSCDYVDNTTCTYNSSSINSLNRASTFKTTSTDGSASTFPDLIVLNGGTLNLTQIILDGGNITTTFGRLVRAKSGTLNIKTSATLRNNKAGGVTVVNEATLNMSGGSITRNYYVGGGWANGSAQGSGIFSSGTVSISAGTISYNEAVHSGGGIFNTGSGTVTITGGTISNNSATDSTSGGGGIEMEAGTLTVSGGTIENNTSVAYGAGVDSTGGATMTFNGGTIQNNTVSAGMGGGIHVGSNVKCYLNSGVTVTGNKSTGSASGTGNGGGLSVSNAGTGGKLYIRAGATISNNTANRFGGAIRIVGNATTKGLVTMTGGTITGNKATGNSGGAFNIDGKLVMSGGEISSNTAPSGVGGGVQVSASGIFELSGGTIKTNTSSATTTSGNIYIASGGTYTRSGSPSCSGGQTNLTSACAFK